MRVFIDGVEYEGRIPLNVTSSSDDITITPVDRFYGLEPINHCEHCGRFDMQDRVARSWDEAEAYGWIRRI